MNDAEFVEKVLSGECDAFGQLVRKYQSCTYALAFQRTGNAAVAEEIAQDVFLAAYRKLEQLKDRTRFGAWLRSITIRQCAMWVRSRKGRPRTRPLKEGLITEDPVAVGRSSWFDINALIGQLPERLKAAAVLCLEDELSPSDAAAVLGLKPATLRKRLHDARAQLQRRIVERAEKELRTHLLPKDFAERCVCRCKKSQETRVGKGVRRTMAKKNDCGCGCLGGVGKRPAKGKPKQKEKKK